MTLVVKVTLRNFLIDGVLYTLFRYLGGGEDGQGNCVASAGLSGLFVKVDHGVYVYLFYGVYGGVIEGRVIGVSIGLRWGRSFGSRDWIRGSVAFRIVLWWVL